MVFKSAFLSPSGLPASFQLSAIVTLSVFLLCSCTGAEYAKRNVILIIGDGMDDQQISIARNYLRGAEGELLLDQLPTRSSVRVLTVDESKPGIPVYVADSANSATSIATGSTTSRGRISTTASDDKDLPTIAELAKSAGYGVGIVTTASVTDATPAAFISHIRHRNCENPRVMTRPPIYSGEDINCKSDLKSNGGSGSIAEQIAQGYADVVFGGGLKHFKTNAEGRNQSVIELAQSNGYQTVLTPEELQQTQQLPVLGLFAQSTMPVLWRGENDRRAETISVHADKQQITLPAPMRCEPNPAFSGQPTLKTMTNKALRMLSAQSNRGFFLMVESASIDKQAHRANPCGSIGELQQLEDALRSALAFANSNPETLILVTADHGHAAQIVASPSIFFDPKQPIYSPGKLARVMTPEGQIMGVNYATNNYGYQEHTGTQIPLMANIEGKERIKASIAQPEIFNIMKSYLDL